MILKITPVEYHGGGLQELGSRIVAAYTPSIRFVDIDMEKHFPGFKEKAEEGFAVNEDFLLRLLKGKMAYSLVVTSLPVKSTWYISAWPNFIRIRQEEVLNLEGAAGIYNAGYVTTGSSAFAQLDNESRFERLVKNALHEVGHMLGLDHHWKESLTPNAKLCPMIGKAQATKNIDYILCDRCYKHLGIKR